MNLPFFVQLLNKPGRARFVGEASELIEPEEVAGIIGVPPDLFWWGMVVRRKGVKRWLTSC